AAGALVGLGVLLVWRGLVPARPPLSVAVGRLTRPSSPSPITPAETGHLAERIGAPVARLASDFGLNLPRLRNDLRVIGRSVETQLAIKVGAACYCAILVPGVAGVIALGGGSLPAIVTLWGATGGAVVGFLLPDWLARAEAA